jgi:phosphoglycerate dehydrogenase-like enzyme
MTLQNTLVTLPVSPEQRHALESAAPGAIHFIKEEEAEHISLAGVDSIIGNFPLRRIPEVEGLKWLQLGGVGAEGYLERVPAGALLTNATGAYGQAVAEHAFAMAWALLKKLHLYRDNQRSHLWRQEGDVASIRNATVLIVGMGDIGRHFARMAKAFGACILAVRRQAGVGAEGADETHPLSELRGLLPRADVVLVCLPGNASTRGILGAAEFAVMKRTALLLNVGRGLSVDTAALSEALASGQIFGAGLDVTDPEPLPEGHPLWAEPNALITPHVAGGFHLPATLDAVVRIAAENLRRIGNGEAPLNIVNRSLGYSAKHA